MAGSVLARRSGKTLTNTEPSKRFALDTGPAEQANVILEAVGETMEKQLDDKFDPVIN